MILRESRSKLLDLAGKFKCVAVIGPRQSGNTTLVKRAFVEKEYVSLENPDNRQFAIDDPRGFLQSYPNGAIIDEIQRVPQLFSYLQEILDNSEEKGKFILTGSNNFLMQENISQTLAGRVAYLSLLPFTINELINNNQLPGDDNKILLKGFYPPIYDQQIPADEWCANYIRTYIERDVRQIKNITDLLVFERFLKLLAGRSGQEFNASSLAVEAGVDVKTVQSWVGVLESSFIIYLLKPHHKNFNKTIVKRPKVYFYDTAIVCSLLGIKSIEHIISHPLRGALFETMVVTEFVKFRMNKAIPINLFYWRDKTGHEIDLIIDDAGKLLPIEIKSGKTINSEFFKNLKYWKRLSGVNNSILLYGGTQKQERSDGIVVQNWKNLDALNDKTNA
ncbi:MAG: AAA family ATPase [Marinilabiliales bacterium]|nr:MAG: AAA family ATPase [Marinilabiliales bacterium]